MLSICCCGQGRGTSNGGIPVPIQSRLDSTSAFDPETIRILTAAFEAAWRSLRAGDGLGPDTDEARDRLAKRIILVAQGGERNLRKLPDDAIAFMHEASHWKP
jgi:hypothetical protein